MASAKQTAARAKFAAMIKGKKSGKVVPKSKPAKKK